MFADVQEKLKSMLTQVNRGESAPRPVAHYAQGKFKGNQFNQ
jgi:hypothetical protein